MVSRREQEEENPQLTQQEEEVVRAVGIGAVKYADLSMNRESNYRFSYERMLSLNGNTAPYMLYAYARLCGIILKATGKTDVGEGGMEWPEPAEVIVSHDAELQLIRTLVKLPDVLAEVEAELYPNRLCDYLFETSQKFNQFYENCSVNNAETPALKASRLTLCAVTAGVLRTLLKILGLTPLDRF
uniref:arginine--tRNA ligase n=1 Tax=Corethron hystrix TaxID=216773 RepID=A0A7S1BWV0_9STRA